MSRLRFIDIGVNLTDPVFRGIHHGKRKHADDFLAVLARAKDAGVKSMIITGGSLSESRTALELAQEHGLYSTVGCHPTRSAEFDKYPGGPDAYLNALDELIQANIANGRVVALGELGLGMQGSILNVLLKKNVAIQDYDRLHFASREVQKKYFAFQLSLAKKYHLPLFLHSRAAHDDFVSILRQAGFGTDGGSGGVVHSFTGTEEEAIELMEMGFYLSVNGCSMKTADNLSAIKCIPPEKLMLETDAPWCSMTSTHESKRYLDALPAELRARYFPRATRPENFEQGRPVKGRNEPCAIGGVAWVVHQLHGGDFEVITEAAWRNTVDCFRLDVD